MHPRVTRRPPALPSVGSVRVAIVTESFLPTLNGVTTSVRQVLEHLRREGHEAMVITPAAGSPRQYAGFPVHEVPAFSFREFPVGMPVPEVQRLIAAFAPDVIHAASPFLLGAAAVAAGRRLGIPVVAVYQTDVARYTKRNRMRGAERFAWRVVRWIHEGASLTLAPSTAAIADLEHARVPRLARWGRGVDLAGYHPNHRHSPAALQLRDQLAPRGEVIVGYVGRVAPEKQLERMSQLRGIDSTRFVVVGDGPARPDLERRMRGIPVTWLGALGGEALATAYAALDVFVHTGTEETFGQTLQEAHASGLPVIAPRAGGPIDLVDHGTTGYLYDPDASGEFRAHVATLAADADLRARMGEAGRRAVLGRTWESVCRELIGHYESVLTPTHPLRASR